MVRLKHHIVVEAVARPWVDAFVAGVYDAFVDLRFDGGRLVDVADGPVELFLLEGRHAAPDARYRLTYPVDPAESPGERRTLEVVVTAMDRAAKTSLAISSEEGGERLAMKLVLRSVARPDAVLAVGTMRWPGRPRSFRRVSWSVQIDVDSWWKRVGRHGGRHGGPPVVAKITHSLAGATITIVPRSDKKGRWTVDIVAAVHGRSWARPLAFVALPFVRGSLHTEYRRVLDEVAEDVNRAAAAFAHEDPDQLARDCFTPGALARRFQSVRPPDTGDQWPGHPVT